MSAWQILLASGLSLTAIVFDLYARRVPNWSLAFSLALGVAFSMTALSTSKDSHSLMMAFTVLIIVLAVFYPLFMLGWMGAGDVKLLCVLAFILGFPAIAWIWAGSCLTLTMHNAGRVLLRPRYEQLLVLLPVRLVITMDHANRQLTLVRQGRKGMPYAAHIGLCTLLYLLIPGGLHAA